MWTHFAQETTAYLYHTPYTSCYLYSLRQPWEGLISLHTPSLCADKFSASLPSCVSVTIILFHSLFCSNKEENVLKQALLSSSSTFLKMHSQLSFWCGWQSAAFATPRHPYSACIMQQGSLKHLTQSSIFIPPSAGECTRNIFFFSGSAKINIRAL